MEMYKGYTIQHISTGCIIRDSNGNFLIETVNEEDAIEYIQDHIEELVELQKKSNKKESVLPLEEQFKIYCSNLPGKVFLDSKLATTDRKSLTRFIEGFSNSRDITVDVVTETRGGETFYIVDNIY